MSEQPPYSEYIEESLWSLVVPIEALRCMENNPRKHETESIEAIKASIKIFKQQKPVVVSADQTTIIAGNGTLTAMIALGCDHIAASKSGLTGKDAEAYAIADNRTQEKSEFDFDIVRDMFGSFSEILKGATGFTQKEIDDLLSGDDSDDSDEREIGGSDPSDMGDTEFRIIVSVDSAEDQEELIARLEEEGYKCHPLMS